MKSALLFLVFNRPDTTRQVFEVIRAARPARLYVAADGPRANRTGEADACEEVRQIVSAVDWECELKTLFRDRNLGCKTSVSGAIDWFFENEKEGIILEDDVLPLPSFFEFCDELLDRFRLDNSVGAVCGSNLISNRYEASHSYYFSRYCHVWGWATWRRAWQFNDSTMKSWIDWRDADGLRRHFAGNALARNYWTRVFDSAFAGKVDSWAYPWLLSCWMNDKICVLPATNLTDNVGFAADGTHTTGRLPAFALESRPKPMRFPLTHPSAVKRDTSADAFIERYVFGISLASAFKRKLRDLGRSIRRLGVELTG